MRVSSLLFESCVQNYNVFCLPSQKILQAVFWFTLMSGEGLVVCLEIFSTVYSSCVAF